MRWSSASSTLSPSLLSIALAIVAAGSTAYALSVDDIKDGKLQAISSAGIAQATLDFPSNSDPTARTLGLAADSTLKLSFTSTSSSSTSYAALIFNTLSPRSLSSVLQSPTDSESDAADILFRRANSQVASTSVYLSPKKGGKYRWEWDLSTTKREDILSLARMGQGYVKAQLYLVSSTKGQEPVTLDIGNVILEDEASYKAPHASTKWPREWEMERYSVRKEEAWTFREAQKDVNALKALIGLVAVLAPWTILLALSPSILSSLTLNAAGSAYPFMLSLLFLEGSIVSYWIGLINVWRFMPFVGCGALVALVAGQRALGDKMRQRIQAQGGEKVVKMG